VLELAQFNAGSLNNKLSPSDLQNPLHSYEFDVLCVTETSFHAAISNSSPPSLTILPIRCSERIVLLPIAGAVCIITSIITQRKWLLRLLSVKHSYLELCVVDLISCMVLERVCLFATGLHVK
jgi:hypothetical protein